MSFPRYPAYKDSGVEWLGEVPAHWEVKRVKRLVNSIEQGWSPQCEGFPVESEAEWGVLKVGCVNGGTFDPSENKALPKELEPVPQLSIASGDLLVSRANTRELVGSAAVSVRDYPNLMLCDKLYRIRVPLEACSASFLCRYLGSSAPRGQIELGATGASSSMVNIGQSTLMELEMPVPPVVEQREIAAVIERETAKIDALVAEQQRLIELLKEKRQAVISHAVTKGLNPDAPMKESGVEWLGAVPAHWSVSPIGSRYQVQLGKMLDSDAITGRHLRPYLRVADVQWAEINTEDLPVMDFDVEARARFRLMSGDLLVNEGGSYPGPTLKMRLPPKAHIPR